MILVVGHVMAVLQKKIFFWLDLVRSNVYIFELKNVFLGSLGR